MFSTFFQHCHALVALYDFCPKCGRTYLVSCDRNVKTNFEAYLEFNPNHMPLSTCNKLCSNALKYFDFKGVKIVENFISIKEENELINQIQKTPFVQSQSGRNKQVRYTGIQLKLLNLYIFFHFRVIIFKARPVLGNSIFIFGF